MVIEIDLRVTPASVELAEPDDFGGFRVVARGLEQEHHDQLVTALRRIGRVADDGHVFVGVRRLYSLADDRTCDRGWLESFDQMVAYARARGWTDAAGAIRAHVQWTA
jgi:hypothetical protein